MTEAETAFADFIDGENVDMPKTLTFATSFTDGFDTTELMVTNSNMLLTGMEESSCNFFDSSERTRF